MKPNKTITLKDIAKELNISVGTVSRALKDYPDISDKTKIAVNELVEEWNYVPNKLALNLRSNKTQTIGVIIPEIVHHFFSEIVASVIEEAENKGYLVITFQSNELYDVEKKQTELLKKYHVDGMLISLSNETEDLKHLKKVQDAGIPLVMMDKVRDDFLCSKVVIDDYKASYMATHHLIEIGCKKVATIGGPLVPKNAKDRVKGYRDAILKDMREFDTDLIYRTLDSSLEEGYEFVHRVMQDHPDVDGIFCVTDMLALGAIKGLQALGKKVPQDVKVVGFSNWFMASVVTPSITTIHQQGREIGKTAVQILIDEIEKSKNKKPVQFQKVVIPTHLIIRESSVE